MKKLFAQIVKFGIVGFISFGICLLYTSPSPRDTR